MKEKKKKKARGLRIFLVLTLLQWGAFYGIDLYLAPEQVTNTISQNISSAQENESKIKAPEDADQFTISEDNTLVAYTKGKELYLANKDGELYHKNVGRVTYMQWLGKSNSLLYFVQSSSLTGYIIPASTLKPRSIDSWSGTSRKVIQAYFNPYMEFLYLETEVGHVNEVYKFDAVNGVFKFPLPDIRIDRIDFDDKTDHMDIYDSLGRRWEYKNGHLYDPKGKQIDLKRLKADPPPPEETKKDEKTSSTDSSDGSNKGTSTKDTLTKEGLDPSSTEKGASTTVKDTTSQSTKSDTTKTIVPKENTNKTTTQPSKVSGGIEPPVINQTTKQGTTSPTTSTTVPLKSPTQ